MFERLNRRLTRRTNEVPNYGLLYFDHLRGERFETELTAQEDKDECSRLEKRRTDRELTWDDIHSYQLILLKNQKPEVLKSKIISLRLKYQSLVSIAEYNNYMTLRAVKDIEKIDINKDSEEEKLRADCKYLIDEFYLRYAYASSHEDLRTKLLRWGAVCTVMFLALAILVGVLTMRVNEETVSDRWYLPYLLNLKTYFSTLFVVVFAGIMGAFVSMQQRLQAVTNHGDPIYNLALLTHGWFSIFLSPISGAIFAALLYLFFAAGLLTGSVFPDMKNLSKDELKEMAQKAKLAKAQAQNSSTDSVTNPPMDEQQEGSKPEQSSSNKVEENIPGVGLTDFAINTVPSTSKAFALLIIWSFIAGFAERFVPDTLMRLVNQKKVSETTST